MRHSSETSLSFGVDRVWYCDMRKGPDIKFLTFIARRLYVLRKGIDVLVWLRP